MLSLNSANLGIPSQTLDTIYYAIVGAMRDTAIVLTFLGVVIGLPAGWAGAGHPPSACARSPAR